MKTKAGKILQRICNPACRFALVVLVAATLGAGCSSARKDAFRQADAAKPPAYLIGPATALFTNSQSFSANVVVETPPSKEKAPTISGQLLGRGSRLFFVPKGGAVSFIWDTKENSGYSLSEALQGYAPISSGLRATNLTQVERQGPLLEEVSGYSCRRSDLMLEMDDGTQAQLTTWRAGDLKQFPLRIKVNGAVRFTMTFSKVRFENMDSGIFQPPDGFTRFANVQVMSNELLMRQNALKQKSGKAEMFDEGPEQPELGGHRQR